MSPKIAVITGASAGVGRATARAFAADGYDIALLARGEDGLEAAAKEVEAAGRRALPIPTDVADWEAVDAAAARAEEELGPIDVWVNDAMTTVFARFHDVRPEEFRRATEVTYLGQVHGTMAALQRMKPRDRGTIVNVGSALAFAGIPLQSAYCGAKFAVRGFTQSVQAELREEGSNVKLTTVHLPAVNTPQFGWCRSRLPKHPQPVPPIYQPESAAEAILTVAHSGRREKVMGAWNQLVVWGAKLVPGAVSHYVSRTGVSSQQADVDADASRPDNLFEPVDEEGGDHGAHGIFDERAGGTADAGFLKSVPKNVGTFARSFGAAMAERWRNRESRVSS